MKRFLLVAILVLISSFILGCNNSGKTEGQSPVGNWELSTIIDENGNDLSTLIGQMKEAGIELPTIEVRADGTALFDAGSDSFTSGGSSVMELTWDQNTFTGNGVTQNYEIVDSMLRLYSGEQVLVFGRIS